MDMTPTETTFAIAALLLTPGPTNTLLALAGAERGVRRALRLIPVELAGYLTTVIPLTFIGVGLLATYPQARPVITLVAAVWVMWLAVSVWRLPAQIIDTGPVVTPRRVFVTTLLNPKALIFGLVLLPSATGVWINISNFILQVIVIAILWATLGTVMARATPSGKTGLPDWLRRIAALWLGFVSVSLIVRVLSA